MGAFNSEFLVLKVTSPFPRALQGCPGQEVQGVHKISSFGKLAEPASRDAGPLKVKALKAV